MNTKTILGAIIIILIAVIAYVVYGSNNTPPPSAAAPDTNGQQAAVPASTGPSSLSALVAAGQPVTCTFSTTTTSGTIYVANGMVAGDFTTNDPKAGAINAHMIVRDQTSYMWTSMSNQGFKSTVSTTPSQSAPKQGVDYTAPMNFQCQPWIVDVTKFDLPTTISFVSTSGFTPPPQGAGATGAAGGGAKGSAAQCAACNQLPSAQKAQCLAALSCQ